MKLSEYREAFEKLGIHVAAMTYDDHAVSRKFTEKNDLHYPILKDIDAQHVKRFGILNENYEPGHRAYGIPHPGMFLVDDEGIIRAKFAEEDYRDRPAFEEVLKVARSMVNGD